MNLIEPKRRWADPSKAKLYVCSIPNIQIYLAVLNWSQTRKFVSLFPYNKEKYITRAYLKSKIKIFNCLFGLVTLFYTRRQNTSIPLFSLFLQLQFSRYKWYGAPPKHRVLEHQQQKHRLLLHRLSKTSTVDNIEYKNIY